MSVTDITIPVGGQSLPGYLAVPAEARVASWPGVVVIHEAFGLNDDIKAQGRRARRARLSGAGP